LPEKSSGAQVSSNKPAESEAAMTLMGRLFGGKTMAALAAGKPAPEFKLPSMEGAEFSLENALVRGPVLAVFFKISCPVCQYALPFFERIHRAHGADQATVIGVSQNEKQDTSRFLRRFDITFPILLDDTKAFPVSNAYGLTNVPTAFWISREGEIEVLSVGWSRADFEKIAEKAAAVNGAAFRPLFQPAEKVADFRAG
jgi:peroxiredoxin